MSVNSSIFSGASGKVMKDSKTHVKAEDAQKVTVNQVHHAIRSALLSMARLLPKKD